MTGIGTVDANREHTTITLGGGYCFNFDFAIEVSIILLAREYWENGGGKEQYKIYTDKSGPHYDLGNDRAYRELKCALSRFEGMSDESLDEWRFSLAGTDSYKYFKAINTLYEIRGLMWN